MRSSHFILSIYIETETETAAEKHAAVQPGAPPNTAEQQRQAVAMRRLAAARAGAGAAGHVHVSQGRAHVVLQVFRFCGVGDQDLRCVDFDFHFSWSFLVE
jgi:hypothetical protein